MALEHSREGRRVSAFVLGGGQVGDTRASACGGGGEEGEKASFFHPHSLRGCLTHSKHRCLLTEGLT